MLLHLEGRTTVSFTSTLPITALENGHTSTSFSASA